MEFEGCERMGMSKEALQDVLVAENNFNDLLGMEIIEAKDGCARIDIKVQAKHRNHLGSVHGGCLFALADSTGGTGLRTTGVLCTTISSSIDYLNAAFKAERLIARSQPKRIGNKVAVYDVEIEDEAGNLICRASITYYILKKN